MASMQIEQHQHEFRRPAALRCVTLTLRFLGASLALAAALGGFALLLVPASGVEPAASGFGVFAEAPAGNEQGPRAQ